jgi:predicted DNA-binding transcriptional regulator AlpA
MIVCNPSTRKFFMTEKINPIDLVGANEIADRLGLAFPNIVHSWKRRLKDFPKPIAILSMGNIWNWKEVESWAKKTKRLK